MNEKQNNKEKFLAFCRALECQGEKNGIGLLDQSKSDF
jgi:hypothetical protein